MSDPHITREIMLTDYDFNETSRPIVTVKPAFNQVLIRFGADSNDVEIVSDSILTEAVETLGSYIALLQAAIGELKQYHENEVAK